MQLKVAEQAEKLLDIPKLVDAAEAKDLAPLQRSTSVPGGMNLAWLETSVDALRTIVAQEAHVSTASSWDSLANAVPNPNTDAPSPCNNLSALQPTFGLLRHLIMEALAKRCTLPEAEALQIPESLVNLAKCIQALTASDVSKSHHFFVSTST